MALSDVDGLVALLRALHLPGRKLSVGRLVDLADAEWWASTVLRMRWMSQDVATVELGPHGFTGDDAEGLCRVLEYLISLAGLPTEQYWWMLGGVPGNFG